MKKLKKLEIKKKIMQNCDILATLFALHQKMKSRFEVRMCYWQLVRGVLCDLVNSRGLSSVYVQQMGSYEIAFMKNQKKIRWN